MISNAGRMVCAVVCAAPETMPSARPRCTISVPKYEASVTVSAAFVERDALVGAQARVLARRTGATCTASNGREDLGRPESSPSSIARDAHLERLAEDREVGDAAREHGGGGPQDAVVVALGQHDVLVGRRARAR